MPSPPNNPHGKKPDGRSSWSGYFLIASPYLTEGTFFRSVILLIRHDEDGAFGVIINQPGSQRFGDLVEMNEPSAGKSSGQSSMGKSPPDSTSEDGPDNAAWRDRLFIGGPVRGPLLALHDVAGIGDPCGSGDGPTASPSGSATGSDWATVHDHPADPFGSLSFQWDHVPAWVTADEDHLRILFRRSDAKLKFVINYSGWGPGQLEREIEAGGWLTTAADAAGIFAPNEELWQQLVKRCGDAVMHEIAPDVPRPPPGQSIDPGLN